MANDNIPAFDFDDLDELVKAARAAGKLLPDLDEQAHTARRLIARLESLQANADWRPDMVASLAAAAHAIIEKIEEQTNPLLAQYFPKSGCC